MPSAQELKEMGRNAFKESKWDDTIACFTQAIDLGNGNGNNGAEDEDVTCYAMRSAAYQKKGDLEQSLNDANKCIELQPKYVRGHVRKACVLRAQKKYSDEVDCYLQALEHCPKEETLLTGLQMAQRLKAVMNNNSNQGGASSTSKDGSVLLPKTSSATRKTALRLHQNASNGDAAPSHLASFVKESKLQLEWQMTCYQAQIDIWNEMSNNANIDEKVDLLFDLLQISQITTLDQLTKAMKQAASASTGQQAGLLFGDDLKKACDSYPQEENVDDDEDAKLDASVLKSFLEHCMTSLGNCSMGDVAEFILGQILFSGLASRVVTQQKRMDPRQSLLDSKGEPPKAILNDERMRALYVLFDTDGDATVDFKEVAIGLYPLTNSMEASAKNAANLLLMMENQDERVLSYEQFAKLMLSVAAASGYTFAELADRLTVALENNKGNQEMDEDAMKEIVLAEEAYDLAREKIKADDERQKVLDTLSYSRTMKLFELWDADGDGTIDFQELLQGLRRYQKSAMAGKNIADVERDALMIMGHDKDSNQALDPEEFAYAMCNYAEAVDTDLHELIDFMCIVSSKDAEKLEEYETTYQSTMANFAMPRNFRQSLGTILDHDMGEEGGSEEEEDDW